MAEEEQTPKKQYSADWLTRGILTKLGDSLDGFTGRKWQPSSSLAASQLTERIKTLLDSEAKDVPGKGMVVPHNIKLKMQWDKFSDESEDAIEPLRAELLAAAVDHINDSLYYTFAPVTLEIKADYFVEGVKLFVGFDQFDAEDREVGQNVTMMGNIDEITQSAAERGGTLAPAAEYVARYEIGGIKKEKRLGFPADARRSVGRTTASDLVLDDASVSKTHAALMASEGGLSIADTGSTNGTFVNGQRIAYGKAMKLERGDRVKFGDVEVTFEPMPQPETVPELGEAD